MDTFIETPLLQRRILASAHNNEDVAQHVRMRLLEIAHSRPTFAQQQIGYHIKRAAWEATDYARRAATYDRNVLEEPLVRTEDGLVGIFDEGIPSNVPTPEEALLIKEHLDSIRVAISKLPRRQREVITLLVNGYSQKEIAAQLGIGYTCANTHARHAHQRLLAELSQ